MPYREDEDAVRARADALQVDLDRAEAELAAGDCNTHIYVMSYVMSRVTAHGVSARTS